MKSVSIIAIGDELVNGFTLDTNSHWLKQELQEINFNIKKSVNIPDSNKLIEIELKNCLEENIDFVFISGGLGPTHDDITKKALSEYLNLPIEINDKHLKFLLKKFRDSYNKVKIAGKLKRNIETQAEILNSFTSIPNNIGTALGMTSQINNTRLFVLPGVPAEYKDMIKSYIIPTFFKSEPKSFPILTIKTTGITESRLFNLIEDIINNNNNRFKFSILPHFTGVNVRITQLTKDVSINKVKDMVLNKVGMYCYGYDDDELKNVVYNLLLDKQLTLSIAESCTGGLISKKITDFPGSSKILEGSLIAYSNNIKASVLKVSNDVIAKHGAVSSVVAEMMAKNIARHFKTDLGISITGISGPDGGSINKPVGLYYIGYYFKGETYSKKFLSKIKDRKINREISSETALNLIRIKINEYYGK